jgi:signal transduction histidine kinase
MRISTRLRIAALVPALMALVMGVGLAASYREATVFQERQDVATRISEAIADLREIAVTYTANHEDRPRQQFLTRVDQLTRIIEATSFDDPAQEAHLQGIRVVVPELRSLFLQLAALNESGESPMDSALRQEAEQRLTAQLFVRSRSARTDAVDLAGLISQDAANVQRTILILISVSVLLVAVATSVMLALMVSGISRSLSALHEGAEMIGSGDLEYRIGGVPGDELGELAGSLNSMAGQLKSLTVSKSDLEREVESRIAAEAEVKRLNIGLEERVAQRTAQLEAANKELEAFAYSVSHDLRAPLRGIDGFGHALLEDYGDSLDEQGKDFLRRIRSATQQMGHLIDDMLKLARLTRAEMRWTAVDISGLAAKAAAAFAEEHPDRRVDMRIEHGITVDGDPDLLRVVVENLMDNAWKFSGRNPDAVIDVRSETAEAGERVFLVKDNGVGFDMAYAGKLFGAFQRLHRSEEFAGTGVGLATVQRVVNRHGGRVWAEAAVGEGAAFYVALPVRTPDEQEKGEVS